MGMLGILWSGNTRPMTPAMLKEIKRYWLAMSPEQREFELTRMDRRSVGRKASAIDNAQKNGVVLANIGLIVAAVVTLLLTRIQWVSLLAMASIFFMGWAIIIALLVIAPKHKNWEKIDYKHCTAVDDLQAAADGNQVLHHYLDSAAKNHHREQLLQIERREFNIVCWLTAIGVLAAMVAVIAAVMSSSS